jgi:uncharacterized membrane protein
VSEAPRTSSRAGGRAAWSVALLLAALAVYAASIRALTFTGHTSAFTEAPKEVPIILFPVKAAEFRELETHFARPDLRIFLHVMTGGLFIGFGLLQFSRGIRRRWPRLHRVSGWGLATLGVVVGATGVSMGLVDPFSTGERIPSAAMGCLFLAAPWMAIRAIRRGDVARHREWMTRFYAAGLSVVVIRLLGPAALWLFTTVTFRDALGLTFWAGWLLTQLAAELWIRATRAPRAGRAFA